MANPSTESAPDRRFRSSLRRGTLAGFVAAIVAVIAIAGLSYRTLEERTEGARRVAATLAVTKQLETILSLLKDAETGQRGYLLTDAERYLEPYNAAKAALPRAFAEARSELGDDPAQAERLESIERLSAEKLAELKETIDLRRADRTAAALEIVSSNRGRDLMDRIRALVAEMSAAERQRLAVHTREFEQSQWRATLVTWGGSTLLLVLIVVAAYMSSRDSRQQQMEGWIQSGQNELSRRLQGEQSTTSIGEAVATFLSRYVGAQVGAVYVSEGDRLRLAGGWGVSAEAAAARSTMTAGGGGLNEQALKEGRPLHVQNVPEEYFAVTSGLGERRPQHLLLAPTTSDGTANGVLELGFFRVPEAYESDLLSRVTESVGIAFRSAKYRADLQNFLEETQRQAEELQAQQEELRVANEELEQQSRSLQDSQVRMENQQAELEQINSQLEEQTQLLERQKDDLARTEAEARRANQYKSEFLANMSHELRTPLNSSLILAKLLSDNKNGNLDAEQVQYAQAIYSSGNDLLTLINDILDLSKIEAGKLDVRPEPVLLARVVDDVRRVFQPLADEKRLALTTTIDPDVAPSVDTDPTRLHQVLKNLLSNAVKFTHQGGVALRVRREGGERVAFEVRDTGIGIDPKQHDVVFEAFRQADGSTNRNYGGTGLGLSISRDLARLLGGELSLDSAPGRGSTFTLVLPLVLGAVGPALAAPPPAPRRPSAPTPRPSGAAPREMAADDDREQLQKGGRTILVIEDDPAFARILRDLAHEMDFQVLIAQRGEEGLALAERYRPSAIVLDVGLPDRSGLSVLDALKHGSLTRHIPVHMMSADDYAEAALAMGAVGYAVKPVSREGLADALRRLEAKVTQQVRRVLVVEDDQVHREATSRLLEGDGVEVVAVGTAREALGELGARTFDCMVLDLTLPDLSGAELLQEMSRQEKYSFPPVIVYTGHALSRDEEQEVRRFSQSIVVKGARSPERLLDEVTLFLHQVESELPAERQRMLRDARNREAVFEGRRILVVEDDVRNIFALSSVFEPRGAVVEIARNGREALEHLEKGTGVDLVLMDVMMPEMDGLTAMREIRKQPRHARLPIIALTAKAMADDREACLAAGASDYIAKPLDVDKLLSLVRVWMPK